MTIQYRSQLKYTSEQYQKSAYYQTKKFSHLFHLPLKSFNRSQLQTEFDKLAPRYKRSSLVTTKKHLHALFELAVEDGYLDSNPCRKIKLPKETFTPKELFTDHEIARLIEASEGYAILPFIVLGGFLGIGPGEVAKIEARHVTKEYITVPGTKRNTRFRTLPMPTRVFELIQNTGLPWTFHTSNTNRALREACERAEIDRRGRTLYSLRHSCASSLAESGCPHDFIARILGHANKTQTMHYSQVSADAMRPHLEARAQNIYAFFGNYLGKVAKGDGG